MRMTCVAMSREEIGEEEVDQVADLAGEITGIEIVIWTGVEETAQGSEIGTAIGIEMDTTVAVKEAVVIMEAVAGTTTEKEIVIGIGTKTEIGEAHPTTTEIGIERGRIEAEMVVTMMSSIDCGGASEMSTIAEVGKRTEAGENTDRGREVVVEGGIIGVLIRGTATKGTNTESSVESRERRQENRRAKPIA